MVRLAFFRSVLHLLPCLVALLVLAGCGGVDYRNPVGWALNPSKPQPPAARTAQTPPPAPVPVPQANVPPAPSVTSPPVVTAPPVVIETKPLESEPPAIVPPPGLAAPVLRAPAAGAIPVALLVPLSGPNANLGSALLDAAQIALFDFGDDKLSLMPRDTKGTPEGAAEAAQAVLAEGAQLIIGPVFAADVPAVAGVARLSNVPVLTFSTDRSVAGNGVWLLGLTPEEQVERVVGFARAKGLSRFGALGPDTPYGAATTAALRRAVEAGGGEIARVQSYAADATDITPAARAFAHYDQRKQQLAEQRKALEGQTDDLSKTALQRLQGLEALSDGSIDAVFLPEGGQRLRSLATMLAFFELDPKKVRYLGTGLWDDPTVGAEPAMQGGWFASADPRGVAEFQKRFEQAYGRRPLRISSIAFDAVALAAVLARDGSAQPFTVDRLTNPDGFAGYEGLFRLRPDGLNQRGLAVIEVAPRGFRVVDPAPNTFQANVN